MMTYIKKKISLLPNFFSQKNDLDCIATALLNSQIKRNIQIDEKVELYVQSRLNILEIKTQIKAANRNELANKWEEFKEKTFESLFEKCIFKECLNLIYLISVCIFQKLNCSNHSKSQIMNEIWELAQKLMEEQMKKIKSILSEKLKGFSLQKKDNSRNIIQKIKELFTSLMIVNDQKNYFMILTRLPVLIEERINKIEQTRCIPVLYLNRQNIENQYHFYCVLFDIVSSKLFCSVLNIACKNEINFFCEQLSKKFDQNSEKENISVAKVIKYIDEIEGNKSKTNENSFKTVEVIEFYSLISKSLGRK